MKAKKHLCFVLCLVLLASLFSSCQTNEFRIYHEPKYCNCGQHKIWYTPYGSDSFPLLLNGDNEYTETEAKIPSSVQFQWMGEHIEGHYQHSEITMQKGMFDLKEDRICDVYRTSGETGYTLYVDRQSGRILSCSSFGNETEAPVDVGATTRVALLEQALKQCEDFVPSHMKEKLKREIDPEGYQASCSLSLQQANCKLFSFGIRLFADGSIDFFSSSGFLQALSLTNMEKLEWEYEQLSSDRALQAMDERLNWLYQTPRADTVFLEMGGYAPHQAALPGEEYRLYREGKWTEKFFSWDDGYHFAPNGHLYRSFQLGIYTKLSTNDGQELRSDQSFGLHISLY